MGYAELFSSFRMKGNDVFVGEVPAQLQVNPDARGWIAVERLFSMPPTDPLFEDAEKSRQYRSEAWALVHYLLFDTPDLVRPTTEYRSAMNVSIPEPEAFADAFPFDKAALDLKLRQLIHHHVIRVKKLIYSSPASIDTVEIKPLTPLEADTELARLVFMLGRPQKLADSAMEAALKERPLDPNVRALAARVAARAKAPFDIADLASKLADGGTADEQIRIDVADALLKADPSKETATRALAILDGVIRRDRPSIEAVRYWSYAGGLAKIDPAQLVAVVDPASTRAPHDTLLLRNLATASELLGRFEAARGYYARIIQVSRDRKERLWAQQQTDSARLNGEQKPAR